MKEWYTADLLTLFHSFFEEQRAGSGKTVCMVPGGAFPDRGVPLPAVFKVNGNFMIYGLLNRKRLWYNHNYAAGSASCMAEPFKKMAVLINYSIFLFIHCPGKGGFP
ncbi:hypothetical protein [Eisenbergiella sp.]